MTTSRLVIVPADDDVRIRDWQHVHNTVIPTAPLSIDDVRERAGRNALDVAYADDVLVGCSTVRPATDDEPVTVIARILPEHRHRGYGGQLYAHCLSRAHGYGGGPLQTIVLASNEDGLAFAVGQGFVETERYLLDGDEVPYVVLVKD
jgi:GNAT superfamily N-acetyltransferase